MRTKTRAKEKNNETNRKLSNYSNWKGERFDKSSVWRLLGIV